MSLISAHGWAYKSVAFLCCKVKEQCLNVTPSCMISGNDLGIESYFLTDESGENRIWLAAAIILQGLKKTVGGNH